MQRQAEEGNGLLCFPILTIKWHCKYISTSAQGTTVLLIYFHIPTAIPELAGLLRLHGARYDWFGMARATTLRTSRSFSSHHRTIPLEVSPFSCWWCSSRKNRHKAWSGLRQRCRRSNCGDSTARSNCGKSNWGYRVHGMPRGKIYNDRQDFLPRGNAARQ